MMVLFVQMDHNSKIIKNLRTQLKKEADPEVAAGARAYMRNKFQFIGVKTPDRRRISRNIIKQSQAMTEKELVLLLALYSPKYSSCNNFPFLMTKKEAEWVVFKFSTIFLGKMVLL